MRMNSYGWIFLIVIINLTLAYVGGNAGFTTNGEPINADVIGVLPSMFSFMFNLTFSGIDGLPFIFTGIFLFLNFMLGWVAYRQIRGIE